MQNLPFVSRTDEPARLPRKFVAGGGRPPAVPVAGGDGAGSEASASGIVPAGEEDSQDGWKSEKE